MIVNSQTDRTNFWAVWSQHRNYFYARCLHWMNGNAVDAEDLLSQAMLKAWDKWPKETEKIANPKAWIARIIHNLCVDFHRQHKRKSQNIETLEEMKSTQILGWIDSPEGKSFYQELRLYLRQAIETLPIKLRDAFILHHYQEKSYKEVAQQLSVSEDAIYKRVQRAIAFLRQQLSAYVLDEDNECSSFSQSSTKPERSIKKVLDLNMTELADFQDLIVTKNSEEPINYNISVLCLPMLSRAW